MLKGLGPHEPPTPQYYKVACPQGHWLQGRRTDGYQALRCPTCGGGIFVLPLSPLPDPPPLATRSQSRAASAPMSDLDDGPIALSDPPSMAVDGPEIDWREPEEAVDRQFAEVEIPEPSPEPASPPAPRSPKSPTPARPRPVARREEPEDIEDEDDDEEEDDEGSPSIAAGGALWRRRHLILFVGVATVVVAAVGLNVRRQRLLEAPKIAEIGRTEGLQALDAGEFDRAKELLTRAALAVDALGGEFRDASEIRQGAREAEIYADLVPERLEAILDEARAANVDGWAGTFRRKYRGRAVAMDVLVTAEPADGRGYEIDYRVLTPGALEPVVARFDFKGFGLFERSKLKVGDRAIFGARLESLDRDQDAGPDGRKGWRITLMPESGVNLGHDKALDALGMPLNDVSDEGSAP